MRVALGILLVVVVAALFWWQTPVPGGRSGEPATTNRLAAEPSPYLQLHADNPVDWYPWGSEALTRAREEDKPIFLSVGYSTCYWCHVMERLVFSDPEIATAMNRDFVNVKVDREERPDLDEIYMTATLLLRGSGGWPNSVFLTPEGEPFFAGTYFPPEDGEAGPGFPTVLERMAQLWRDERERVRSVAADLTRAIRERSEPRPAAPTSFDPASLVANAVDELALAHDGVRGGFSTRPKFPNPPKLELLLVAHENGDEAALPMLTRTLDAMALGGIYDHLAGGFHRYATDAAWSVPHFEKMLYDNAQLLGLYARAWSVTRSPLYRRVVEEVSQYLEREMTHEGGGLYSAQDAQVGDEEGASYVWERAEIAEALGADGARDLLTHYELAPMPEGPAGVLRLPFPATEGLTEAVSALASARATLLERRQRRPQPLRDEKILAAWNGLAIRGLVEAASALGRSDLRERAERAADFVLTHHRREDGGLHRSWIGGQARERAVLDDYAFLADGLLALHRATGDPEWLARARELAERMIADHEDTEAGGFYLTVADDGLVVRPRPLEDGALPAGNGVALRVVRRLAELTGEDHFEGVLERATAAHAPFFERTPSVTATALGALAPSQPTIAAKREPVHVTARAEAARRIVVRVELDAGWHVNANPASLPSLIPTSVDVESGGTAGAIRYPEGVRFEPEFVPEPLSVYEGVVTIPVELSSRDGGPLELAVRYQACDLKICLAPKTARLTIDP